MCTAYHTSRDQYMVFLFFMRIHVGLAMYHALSPPQNMSDSSRGQTQVDSLIFSIVESRGVPLSDRSRRRLFYSFHLLLSPVRRRCYPVYNLLERQGPMKFVIVTIRTTSFYVDQMQSKINFWHIRRESREREREKARLVNMSLKGKPRHTVLPARHLEFPFIVIP